MKRIVGNVKAILSLAVLPVLLFTCVKEESGITEDGEGKPEYYNEQYRPQFHFTPEKNWMNDPNGLMYYEGEYHLFYQHNPFGNQWGHMSWGHAVSEDLLHWEHLPVALEEENNIMIFSGSAVADTNNTSGLGSQENPPIIAIYTGNHTDKSLQDQRIAYSLDKGRTWTKYSGNPVIDESMGAFRDPKVFWHEPTEKWVMIVALPNEFKVRLYDSTDLINWEHLSEFGPAGATGGVWECPDLFQLPVDGEPGNKKWVLQVDIGDGGPFGGSSGQYFIGEFDGKSFTQDSGTNGEIRWVDYGKDFYAVQSFANIPENNGRRIWLAWMSNWQYAGEIPTSSWRSAMTIPREVSLKTINGTVTLIQEPVDELASLRGEHYNVTNQPVEGESNLLKKEEMEGKTLEIKLRFETKETGVFGVKLAKGENEETVVGYDMDRREVFIDRTKSGKSDFYDAFPGVHSAPLNPQNGVIELHILLDWSSVEVFGNGGQISITDRIFPETDSDGISLFATGETVQVASLDIWKIHSAWN